jgi:hypothetical protein
MRPSISRLLIGLFAAPLMLASSAALASPGADACGNIELLLQGSCDFEVAGGCKADCTPLNFVAACDGQCTATADLSCTGGCEASCETECNVNPGSFDCAANCDTTCKASCSSSCSDSACQTNCEASCGNRCELKCKADLPSADCTAQCKASCDASCTVQANVDCQVMCSASLQGGCEVACDTPRGALFCPDPSGRPQYVNVPGSVDDCIAYLESQGLQVQVTATCDANGCNGSASIGCAAAPNVGADSRLGVGAIAGLMMGAGMIVSRRRRRRA